MKAESALLTVLVAGTLFALTACQTASRPRPGEAVQPSEQRIADAAVDEGAKRYEAGNFQAAIKFLSTTNEIHLAGPETQIKAHKLLAFSYCSTGKISFCRAEFVKILAIDPSFKLSESERLHPIWGPVFASIHK